MIGFTPLACWGKRWLSRSLAAWLSVPGSDRSLLKADPESCAAPPSPISSTNHTPSTTHRRRAHRPPSP